LCLEPRFLRDAIVCAEVLEEVLEIRCPAAPRFSKKF
jgi:hypothetical protein